MPNENNKMMKMKQRLMVPGPTPIPPEVVAAGIQPMIDERTPEFGSMFARVHDNLKQVFLTENDVLLFTSSITGAMEGAMQNLFSPGDKVLVAVNGFFGHRWVEIGTAYGLDMVELAYEWGEKVDYAEVEATLAADKDIKAAVCVQCETSSGIVNDIEAFGRVTRDVISIVDAASSLGACELRTDLWGIDVVVSGGQKALMTPPGVSFVSISERAWAAHATSKMPRYYFDWTAAKQSFQHKYPHTPWTPAISLIFQLDAALKLILAEGMENVFARHILLGRSAREGVKAIGLRLMVPDEDMHSAVTTVWMPEGYQADEMVERLVRDHGVQITDGPGSLKESVFRIGHCGHFDAYDMILTIAAIELTLESMGYEVELGRGVAAAQRVFSRGKVTT